MPACPPGRVSVGMPSFKKGRQWKVVGSTGPRGRLSADLIVVEF